MSDAAKEKFTAVVKAGKVEFHYQKSPHYRTIFYEGAYGGVTNRGYLSITIYNERNTVPRRSSREILEADEDTGQLKLGPEHVEEGLEGVLRHMETTVLMDINAAREFHSWFNDKLSNLEEHHNVPNDERLGKKNIGDGE